MADLLFWCDLETTGLDVRRDRIVEVAVVLTDTDLVILSEFHCFLERTGYAEHRMKNLPDVVFEMHKKSGLYEDYFSDKITLLPELIDENAIEPHRMNERTLDEHLVMLIHQIIDYYNNDPGPNEPLDRIVLAGAGVSHMEDKWFEYWLPLTFKMFHYRALDVSVIRSGLQTLLSWEPQIAEPLLSGMGKKEDIAHRAMDDVMDCLQNAHRLISNFQEITQHA